jgi:cupin fold WbuC family metalloprotein
MKNNIDLDFIHNLLKEAAASPRLRMNYDMRNSAADTSQRMINALLPGTQVPIHRHENTEESVMCLYGKLEEIFFEKCDADETGFKEIARHTLCPKEGKFGLQVPMGMWHTIHVIEPSIIFEAKDGAYIPQ